MIKMAFVVVASFILLSCCLCSASVPHPKSQAAPSEEKLFLVYLNLDKMPDAISDFRGEATDTFPVFQSSGYFSYQAEPGYFDMLKQDDHFIEQSEFNELIHSVDCIGQDFPDDFSWWTKDSISITGKTCLKGVFFPYIHYILYDPQTMQVIHFVEGMRD
jgi:hypothetical protein